jgi:hypothetical protein
VRAYTPLRGEPLLTVPASVRHVGSSTLMSHANRLQELAECTCHMMWVRSEMNSAESLDQQSMKSRATEKSIHLQACRVDES